MKKIKKRDGRIVDFDPNKIHTAIFKAMMQAGEGSDQAAAEITAAVEAQCSDSEERQFH